LADPKGLFTKETRYIGLSYNDPQVTPSDKLRYDACLTVPDEVDGEGPAEDPPGTTFYDDDRN